MNVDAVSRRPFISLVKGKNFKFEVEFVDRNRVFSRIILSRSSQESLGEEESRNPKYVWLAEVKPILKTVHIRAITKLVVHYSVT